MAEEGNSASLSRCSGGLRPLVKLCVEPVGLFLTMHGGVSAPSCCAFPHRVAFEEVSGHRVLIQSRPGNRGRSACGTTHVARLEFPRETGFILRSAGNSGNPFKTKQGNRLYCRDQKGEGAQMKGCRDPRCSPRGKPACRGTLGGRMKRVRYRFALQGRTWDFPGDAVESKGLIL